MTKESILGRLDSLNQELMDVATRSWFLTKFRIHLNRYELGMKPPALTFDGLTLEMRDAELKSHVVMGIDAEIVALETRTTEIKSKMAELERQLREVSDD